MYEGTGATTAEFDTPGMTWDFVERLKGSTGMKVVIKGIVTAQDAENAVQHGVEKVLDILRAELAMVMGQMGTPTLKDIGPDSIGRH